MFKVDNEFANAKIGRNIRFTDKLFDELGELAAKKKISFNLLVLQCCRYALDNMMSEYEEEDA